MRVEIDGSTVRTEDDLHGQLARALDFGPYYGRNLDALWDRLTTDVERPVDLVWKNSEAIRKAFGDERFQKWCEVLHAVQSQDERWGWTARFTVRFE